MIIATNCVPVIVSGLSIGNLQNKKTGILHENRFKYAIRSREKNFILISNTHSIASACAEPSFTGMKYLKRYFGNTMTEFRLNGLAVIAVRQTVAVRNQGAIARCYIQSSISNLRKPVFNATCAVSVFYANWDVSEIISY
ncbi:hypothetical protein T09_13679 [Trichinella sp. T9]|nr:hypothetical protein T09_13679 [Trichinella sp. T9]